MTKFLMARMTELAGYAVGKWGRQPQQVKAMEECGELIVQLAKFVNGSPTSLEAIIDEIADVQIVVWQMRLQFGESATDIRIHQKLDRLEKAIKEK